jgi:hypothetical protein
MEASASIDIDDNITFFRAAVSRILKKSVSVPHVVVL